MSSIGKTVLLLAAGLAGGVLLGTPSLKASRISDTGFARDDRAADTAVVRLHISKMTCGSCPTTARLALKKLSGVFDAKVTLPDSLGVVWYDPRRVTPPQIAAHLTRLTGYGATVLPDTAAAAIKPRIP